MIKDLNSSKLIQVSVPKPLGDVFEQGQWKHLRQQIVRGLVCGHGLLDVIQMNHEARIPVYDCKLEVLNFSGSTVLTISATKGERSTYARQRLYPTRSML